MLARASAHPPSILSDQAEKATVEEVKSSARPWTAAIETKDAAALRRIYADSFTHTHGSGKVDGKDARIVSALAGDPVIENAPVDRSRHPCARRLDRHRHGA